MSRFLSRLQHSRPCCIGYTTLAYKFGSSLYIRYNTAAHVVNSTYKAYYIHTTRSTIGLHIAYDRDASKTILMSYKLANLSRDWFWMHPKPFSLALKSVN